MTALNEMAIAHQKLGQPFNALQSLNRYHSTPSYITLMICLIVRAVGLAPNHLQSVGNLANAMKDIGDLNGAAEMGLRGVEIEPQNALVSMFQLSLKICSFYLDRSATIWG